MKRQIMGREVVVAITDGKLDFGPWEQIFYGEFDGGRRKRVLVVTFRRVSPRAPRLGTAPGLDAAPVSGYKTTRSMPL